MATYNKKWVLADDDPLFLKPSGKVIKQLNCKHLNEAMGVDVTGYTYRRHATTWFLNHEDKSVNEAESRVLQHTAKVAQTFYDQADQSLPQRIYQQYCEEENIYPDTLAEKIRSSTACIDNKIKEDEKIRKQTRIDNMMDAQQKYKNLRNLNKPLGLKHRIKGFNVLKFRTLLEKVQSKSVKETLQAMKPKVWRNFVVKLVCSVEGLNGHNLRKLWKDVYQGDLEWGVRDVRRRALVAGKMKNLTHLNDRNSWIASALRASLVTLMKKSEAAELKVSNENADS